MCGDVEEDGSFETDLFNRLVLRSQALVRQGAAAGDPLNAYLDRLFADVLTRCIDDAKRWPSSDAYRLMTMQSVVLARLAGFLAGHGSLNEDPLRKLLEATMLGYGEAEAPLDLHGHDHDHEHGHDHEHPSSHRQGREHVHDHPDIPGDSLARADVHGTAAGRGDQHTGAHSHDGVTGVETVPAVGA